MSKISGKASFDEQFTVFTGEKDSIRSKFDYLVKLNNDISKSVSEKIFKGTQDEALERKKELKNLYLDAQDAYAE